MPEITSLPAGESEIRAQEGQTLASDTKQPLSESAVARGADSWRLSAGGADSELQKHLAAGGRKTVQGLGRLLRSHNLSQASGHGCEWEIETVKHEARLQLGTAQAAAV